MSERRYTISEIDRMRECLHAKLTADLDCYGAIEMKEDVERALRTAMLAGVSPEELEIATWC